MVIGDSPFRLGGREIDPSRSLITSPEGSQRIEPKVMDVLCSLARAEGQVVSRPEIMDSVWSDTFVTEGVLSRAISLLRSALDDGSGTPVIETVPRKGYRLAVAPALAAAAPVAPGAVPRSIAVLPFADFSAESSEHLADGLTDVLITELARLRALRVISRTSAMVYREGPRNIREIGRALGADLIVEGSVQKIGEELRITAQLIESQTDNHLWAETYIHGTGNMLRLLGTLAVEIAQEVRVSLTAEEKRALNKRTASPQTVEAYLRGRHLWNLRSREGFLQAIDLFKQVLHRDPEHVESMCALADCYVTLALYGMAPARDVFPQALEAVNRALELEPESPDALRAISAVALFWDWRLGAAEAGFRRCLELAPSDAQARLALADTLAFSGRGDEAIREIQSAFRLDPLDPGMRMNVGDMYLFAGRFSEALESYKETAAHSPGFARVYRRMATAHRALGQLVEAEQAIDRAHEILGAEEPVLLDQAKLRAALGDSKGALERLHRRTAIADRLYLPPVEVAQTYAELGDSDSAFEWLDRALAERSPWTVTVGIDPILVKLAEDPRYPELLAKIGVPAVAMRRSVDRTDIPSPNRVEQ